MLHKSGGIEFIISIEEDAEDRPGHCCGCNQTTLTWATQTINTAVTNKNVSASDSLVPKYYLQAVSLEINMMSMIFLPS